MMKLRAETLAALAGPMAGEQASRLVPHFLECFPEECRKLYGAGSEHRVKATIQAGIEQALQFGITGELALCRYVSVIFIFGTQFHRDPSLPWAAQILNNDDLDPELRVEQLFFAAQANAHLGQGVQHIPEAE